MNSKISEQPHRGGQRYVVCSRDELKSGEIRTFWADRRRLAIICLEDGSYRAVSDTCPHEGASLSNGKVECMWTSDEVGEYKTIDERTVLICPWHNFEFDVDTGVACSPERLRVKTYEVDLEGDQVIVYV